VAATDPTTVWRIRPGVVLALASRLASPTDAYVNGSQVWLAPGPPPAEVVLEWRLHPSATYRLPGGLSPHELWDQVVAQLVTGAEAGVLRLGDHGEAHSLDDLWDGLEAYPAYGDEITPDALAEATETILGLAPDAAGLVDHAALGEAWDQADGRISLVALLFEQLAGAGGLSG
jgi:hypothetical protein